MLIAILLLLLVILVVMLVLTTRMVRVVNAVSQSVPITGTTSLAGLIVGNTPANPVPLHETVRPELQPFVHGFPDLRFNGGQNQDESTLVFTVPAGKRLVLEDVSVGAILGVGQRLEINLIRISVGGEHHRHAIAVFHQVTKPGGSDVDFLAGGRPIRIYLEPGEKLTAAARRNSIDEGAFIDVFVYGYFVDL